MDVTSEKKTVSESEGDVFDQVISLVSEIVIIKGRLQQLMDNLNTENRRNKLLLSSISTLNTSITESEKELHSLAQAKSDSPVVAAMKKIFAHIRTQCDVVRENGETSDLAPLALDFDEVNGRFGKALGELQGVLMKRRSGSGISIIQVLLVKLGEDIFAFPLEAVLEIVKVQEGDIYSVDGNETIRLRDHVLGLVRLQKTIGICEKETATHKPGKRIVVISNGSEEVGVIVDSLLGEEDIVVKRLPKHFDKVKGVSGASILGDGSVALILEPSEIIKHAQHGLGAL